MYPCTPWCAPVHPGLLKQNEHLLNYSITIAAPSSPHASLCTNCTPCTIMHPYAPQCTPMLPYAPWRHNTHFGRFLCKTGNDRKVNVVQPKKLKIWFINSEAICRLCGRRRRWEGVRLNCAYLGLLANTRLAIGQKCTINQSPELITWNNF